VKSCSGLESEQLCGIGAEAERPGQNTKSSELVGEVFPGNTLEEDHPCAQAGGKGVDVLHMLGALYAYAGREIDRMMLDLVVCRGRFQGDALSVNNTVSAGKIGPRTMLISCALTDLSMKLAELPMPSRAMSIGTYSKNSPRLRDAQPIPRRLLFQERRKYDVTTEPLQVSIMPMLNG